MKKNYLFTLLLTILISVASFGQDLLITGVYDGPLSGGTPKGVELFVVNDINDLSLYGIGSANNGSGTDGEEFTFPNDAVNAGTFIYLTANVTEFNTFFGFNANYDAGSAMNINGDDAIELFMSGNVIDLFGDINVDGNGETWEYLDGWAYRKSVKTASTTFNDTDWSYSGANAFDGESTNATAATPFPIGTYSPTATTTPNLSVSNSLSGLDYFEANGPSEEKEMTISGDNLTTDITVTAPTNFEVSLTSGASFASSVTLTPNSGSVASTTVYIRLVSGLSSNTYSGDVTVSSTGVSDATITVSGEVKPADPQFTITEFLDPFTYIISQGGPSDEQDFTVEGLFLTNDLVVTAPTNFEVSLTSGSSFNSTVSITPSSGTISETSVYVRLKDGLSAGDYSGDITISSTNVTNQTISITGTTFGAPTSSMLITGVYDGSLSGGTPKGIELYVLEDISDLSLFGVSSANNGNGSTAGDVEFSLPEGAATAGTFIYISTEETNFNTFFGKLPDYTTNAVGINGDDAIELYENGQIIDVFGDVDQDGTGLDWEYLDGWAYRKSNTDPEGTTFTTTNWTYSGINGLEGGTTNATATTPFPIATYTNSTASINYNAIDGFALYPNPVTNNNLTITSNSSKVKSISIFNVLGKNVLQAEVVGNKAEVNTSVLPSGIYIIKVKEGLHIATSKLVIK
ncbi:T9SS type A sorting domain-containing protein [Polaribacter sp.]|uniref:T9SS type A sorting domain-containing protein n=1 Tax=Polaribacter sp. TaxID=1920175 RepID=UPI003F69A401